MFSHTNLVWNYHNLVGASVLDDSAFPSHALIAHIRQSINKRCTPIVGSEAACLYYPV